MVTPLGFPKVTIVLKELREMLPRDYRVSGSTVTNEDGSKDVYFRVIIERIGKKIDFVYPEDHLGEGTIGFIHKSIMREVGKHENVKR